MKAIYIEETEDTPKVVLDKDKGIFELSGKSLPHNPSKFYFPLLEWIGEYAKEPNPQTDFMIKMDYFNTASSKMLLDLFEKLERIHAGDTNVKVFWYHDEDDVDMEEAGEEYGDIVDVPFELLTYS